MRVSASIFSPPDPLVLSHLDLATPSLVVNGSERERPVVAAHA
jgi:hypothetical protein